MKVSSIKPAILTFSRELLITALLLVGVSLVVFIVLYLAPGDPFSQLLEGQKASSAARDGAGETPEISSSWWAQYLLWLGNMLKGNFGTSIRTGLPVFREIIRVGINDPCS
jgi:peptide/nickel transport system permease protein